MWGLIYPVLVHFCISQVAAYGFLAFLDLKGLGRGFYISHVIELTGISALLTTLILIPAYRRDASARRDTCCDPIIKRLFPPLPEAFLLLLMGAGLAQYLNLLVNFLYHFLPESDYAERMASITDGRSLFLMILWMGIAAPIGEEMVFRLLLHLRLRDHLKRSAAVLITSLLFGAYHLDLFQGLYAGLMGIFFAVLLEFSGSLTASMLLHISANTWGLLLDTFLPYLNKPIHLALASLISALLLVSVFGGLAYFWRKCQ